MMSVLEYALDVNKSVNEVIEKGLQFNLGISKEDDMLNDEQIVILDNAFSHDDDEVEEIKEMPITKPKKIENKITNNKNDFQNKKKEMYKNKEKLIANVVKKDESAVYYSENMTINTLAERADISAKELVKKAFLLGLVLNVNSSVDFDVASLLMTEFKKELKKEEAAEVHNFENYDMLDDESALLERPPVVTIMGHVDHGKTTLLDTIRNSSVADKEVGGITQGISAYQVKINDKKITFIDTPGHAAFTEMRARGANITDIVIIIVAADDGVMPQTKEAIDHAKASGVPIIVAINKIDKEGSNPDRIMTELSDYDLVPDNWGGNTLYSKISAKNNIGIEELLENILLIAEMENYKANPKRYASGSVIEAKLDKQVGPMVTILVQNGSLRIGDPIVVGNYYGKVRTMKNDLGEDITSALPSTPVTITGLNDIPSAGDKFMCLEGEKEARSVSEKRIADSKVKDLRPSETVSLEELFSKIKEGKKEINIIIKADTNGSSEAIKNALEKIEVEGVKVKVVRSSVGAITESDVVLAKASKAVLIGFNVRPNNKIKDYATDNGVEIRLYNIIYKVVEEIEAAMKGMLDPEYEEKILGNAEVRQLFKFSKIGTIAGCYIVDGLIKNGSDARVLRDSIIIYEGKIASLQREKDTVKEVKKGLECGITIENFSDIKEKDIIEAYENVLKK